MPLSTLFPPTLPIFVCTSVNFLDCARLIALSGTGQVAASEPHRPISTPLNGSNLKRIKFGKAVPKCIFETPQGKKFLNMSSTESDPRSSNLSDDASINSKMPVALGRGSIYAPGLDYIKYKYDFSTVPQFEGFSSDLHVSADARLSSLLTHSPTVKFCTSIFVKEHFASFKGRNL